MDFSITTTGQKKPSNDAASPSDPRLPLLHLAALGDRMAILRDNLAAALSTGSVTSTSELHFISSEIASAAYNIILHGASLLTSIHPLTPPTPPPPPPPQPIPTPTTDESDDFEIIELDSVELLAEHIHFCEICGKGFRRDANLRMHMRAHGDRYKTLESLSSNRGVSTKVGPSKPVRFSCPFAGCNRNRCHRRFRPLKSAVCARNHFKRSHCPKMYSCNRCGKKRFAVLADLRSHLKNCGETQWKCSCGTTFSRKDKLFGHLALFEGHMPAVGGGAEEKGKEKVEKQEGKGNEGHHGGDQGGEEDEEGFDEEFFEEWMQELGGIGGGNWPAMAPGR